MGMTDNYKPEDSSFTGMKILTCQSVEFKAASTGTMGINMKFYKDSPEHPMYKTLYMSKKFNQFLTAYLLALGLSVMEFAKACNDGQGDDWLLRNMPGRKGEFDCEYGEPNNGGKKYIEPFTKPELEFKKWISEQEAKKQPSQSQQSLEYNPDDYQTPPDGTSSPEDIPY